MVPEMSSRRRNAPISRFSSTVIEVKMFEVCGTKAMPSATRACGVSFVMSLPPIRTDPALRFSIPKTAFIAVDLPAPLGPTMTAISPAATAMVQSCRISAAEAVAVSFMSDPVPYARHTGCHTLCHTPPDPPSRGRCLVLEARPEIGLDHRLVGLHLLDRALGEHAARSHHDHRIAEPGDEIHVVLDDAEGVSALAVETDDRVGDGVEKRAVHPRPDFV